jgi:hypothetical protein
MEPGPLLEATSLSNSAEILFCYRTRSLQAVFTEPATGLILSKMDQRFNLIY